MTQAYARDLDLNLLRVLVVVADAGSVTQAAARLYLTQPAVSAALRRLSEALGAPLFARRGRGLVLTERGARLVADARPHLAALTDAALSPPRFDPRSSERVVRVGLADSVLEWLLPALVRDLEREAPRMRLVALPIQFRTVGEALAGGAVDCAVTVADELPPTIARRPLFSGGFVCLFDPRLVKLGRRPTEAAYLAAEHVVVSYNGDLRGVVEDATGLRRSARCSVASLLAVGPIVDGSRLVATIPASVARAILRQRPHLRIAALPFRLPSSAVELLWPAAREGDDALRFVRARIERHAAGGASRRAAAASRPARPRAAPRARRP